MGSPVRVLVVDDSALVRRILRSGLSQDPDIEVVGTAVDPYGARDRIIELRPDVMTLDVDMPRMDGVEFLRRLIPQHPIPVVMVSSQTREGTRVTLEALAAGAVDFVPKPAINVAFALPEMMETLRAKVKNAASVRVRPTRPKAQRAAGHAGPRETRMAQLIAVGCSTGGTEALRVVLQGLPREIPGIVIVQHMPAGFTQRFAEQLDECCPQFVKEADRGDRILPGRVLVAPGDRHLEISAEQSGYSVRTRDGDRVNGHRPSVDVLMHSVARVAGRHAIGAILTGMGSDGADGLLAMRAAGARTVAQDEASSAVYGMPRAAVECGAVEAQVDIDRVARHILELACVTE
jgi:two-component system chemotaxis response regulator CheB